MSCACQHSSPASPLSPGAQAWYHGLCAARHLLKACAALGHCRIPRVVLALCTLGVCLLFTGCASAPAGSGVFGWWAARGERAVVRAETRHDAAREAQLEAARLEAEKTRLAAAVLPPSPEASLTSRFAANTSDLLSQAVPAVTAGQLAAVRQLVADLRSEDAKVVATAEARQASAEARNASLSRELASTAARLTATESSAHQIATKNAELAGELLALRAAAVAGTVLTIAASLAAVAYRANAFGLADSVAHGLADLRRKDPGAATLATSALDGGLSRAEQTGIGRRVQALLAAAA